MMSRISKKIIAICIMIAMSVSCMLPAGRGVYAKDSDKLLQLIDNMTTRQKVEQLIMPAFRTYDDVDVTVLNDDIAGFIGEHGFAGIALFAQNTKSTEQTLKLIDSIQTANQSVDPDRPQLFISIDQEGGRVTRLNTGTQFTGNMALAATGDVNNARTTGKIIGEELNALGINMDFAPVLDVNNNPANPVIGLRSFSDSPEVTAQYGTAYLEGLMGEGLIATLKHFPGHGDTDTDSHTGFPLVNKSYEELSENELVPFKAAIDAGAEMIMTAHIQYPKLENSKVMSKDESVGEVYVPATLSEEVIGNVLRDRLGYDGVVITDALEMDAIADNFGRLEAAGMAINAGVDILLMPVPVTNKKSLDDFGGYISDITDMVESGKISMEKVNASLLRILKLKEKKGLLEGHKNSATDEAIENAMKTVGSPAHHAAEWEIAKRAVTIVKNDNKTLPIVYNENNSNADSNKKVVILNHDSDYTLSAEYAVSLLKKEGKLDADITIPETTFDKKELNDIEDVIKDASTVIITTGAGNVSGLRNNNASKVDSIIECVHKHGGKAIVISYNLPYDVARYQSADAIVIAYSPKAMKELPDESAAEIKQYGPNVPAAFYMLFAADETVTGRLPVDIPELNSEYEYTDKILYQRGYGLEYENDTLLDKVYNALTDPDSYYSDLKKAYSPFGLDITEELTDDAIIINAVATDSIYESSAGTRTFKLEGDYLTSSFKSDDYFGMLTLNNAISKAVCQAYNIDEGEFASFISAVTKKSIDNDYYTLKPDAASGIVNSRIYIGDWNYVMDRVGIILDNIWIDDDVLWFEEPLSDTMRSTVTLVGRIALFWSGNKDSVDITIGEHGGITENTYKSIISLVKKLQPTGYESFLEKYKKLEEVKTEGYKVSYVSDSEDLPEVFQNELDEHYEYVNIHFGNEEAGSTDEPIATVEPTAEPAATAEPTAEPAATAEPTVAATQEATAVPENTAAPTATAAPSAAATPAATATPSGTAAPAVPSATPAAFFKTGDSISLKAGKNKTLMVNNGVVEKWSSSNKKVATVNNGKVTALKKGNAVITAVLANGNSITCKVKVTSIPKIKVAGYKSKSDNVYLFSKYKIIKVKITGKASNVNNIYTSSNKKSC
jgi:beta-N-acetylhexosaminidase